MKYALLVSRTLENGTVDGWKNIGDYIQSLAAAQFMPQIDEYFDKTDDDIGTNTIKMIMNAWYIWNPEKFPLSKRVLPLPISKINHHYCNGRLVCLKKILYSSIFIKIYNTFFSLDELKNAEFISHMIKVGDGTTLQTEEDKMSYAKRLVKKYASSAVVVTGRIHCALPCLGVETPVIFTVGHSLEEGSDSSSAGRFGGLIDLFNVARINKLNISGDFSFPIKNKDLYKSYAEKLEKRCEDFIND